MFHAIAVIALCVAAQPQGHIAFVSGPDMATRCVCVADVATGTVVRVGAGQRDANPAWSPDGLMLAFESAAGDGQGIRLVRADGSGARTIQHAQSWNAYPRWSPDGTRIAYSSGPFNEARIAVYDLATGAETFWGGKQQGALRPVWADGETIIALALTGKPGALGTEIVIVGHDGVSALPENAMPSKGTYAAWFAEPHPKMFSLLFETNDGGDREIYVVSPKRGPLNVSNNRAADWAPRWSPDGRWVAFESFRSGRRGVYRVNPETVLVQPIAVAPDSDNWAPAWSPDGGWVAFVSDRTGTPEVFVADTRGRDAIQITRDGRTNDSPMWQPRGKKK